MDEEILSTAVFVAEEEEFQLLKQKDLSDAEHTKNVIFDPIERSESHNENFQMASESKKEKNMANFGINVENGDELVENQETGGLERIQGHSS